MLIPKEQPYQQNLNSFYLKLNKFISYLQDEIGSGFIYCNSQTQAYAIVFSKFEVIRCVAYLKENNHYSNLTLTALRHEFLGKTFGVSVYFLDPNAAYYWGKLPAFKRFDKQVDLQATPLKALCERYQNQAFSGFLDIALEGGESGLLFFDQGARLGGSYSWGQGGLSPWEKDYEHLQALLLTRPGQAQAGLFV